MTGSTTARVRWSRRTRSAEGAPVAGPRRVGPAAWLLAPLVLILAVSGSSCTSSATSCPAGQTDCGGACVDLQVDPMHCGACSDSCISGATCSAGHCGCPPPTTSCGIGCVNIQSDAGNCGACGHRCGLGSCVAGACQCSGDPTVVLYCPPGSPQGSCVDTSVNVANCGGCGVVCPALESCAASQCQCLSPYKLCSTGSTTPVCTDVTTDPANCGTCGNTCPAGTQCASGSCAGTCEPGYTLCSGACTDVKTDPQNCGRCGNACATGQSCQSGLCSTCGLTCGGTCCAGGDACCSVAGGSTTCPARHADFPDTAQEISWFDCTPQYTYTLQTAETAATRWRPTGTPISTGWSCPYVGTQSTCLIWQYAPLTTQAECGVFCYTGTLAGSALVTQGYQCPCPPAPGPGWY